MEAASRRQVMGPVLLRYGFSPDKRGSAELRAVIADLANNNKDIRSMNMDIQKLVISNFPDLKSDQAEAAYRAASASTAVSTTEDSPKSNEATRHEGAKSHGTPPLRASSCTPKTAKSIGIHS
ncbi:unnamed protein product [Cladocopium goreaui]|uniref:Protein C10 n=1 Tax=Cladocopium goreaui TaxID=2562237 RepID=A0A9P1DWE6_9DINO|nr:unnamed protein product [Cladocopium goreaui]